MSQKPQLSNLPAELLLYVAGYLGARDLSSLSRLSRETHWRLFYLLFDSVIAKASDLRELEDCLVNLFFHAVKHDSANIAQYLIYSTYQLDLNGYEIFQTMDCATLDSLSISLRLNMSSFSIGQSRRDPCTTLSSVSSTMPLTKGTVSGGLFSLAFLRTSPSSTLPC